MTKPRILYLHGLESKAKGNKYRTLSKIFEASSIKMPISKNILLKNPNNLKTAFILFSAIVFFIMFTLTIKWFYLLATIILLFCTYISHASAFDHIYDKCIDLQVKEIIRFKPDLIIGSSFGGFIALELVRRNIWRGPLILLSSAHETMSFMSGFKMYDMGRQVFDNRVLSVVAKRDHLWFIYSKRKRVQKFFRKFELMEFDDSHGLRETFDKANALLFVNRVMGN
jgi:hypothetical protein